MSANDLGMLFAADEEVRRWTAERENASARLELARTKASRSFLLSQYEPIHGLGIDREALRILLSFTAHHDKSRLQREVAEFAKAKGESA